MWLLINAKSYIIGGFIIMVIEDLKKATKNNINIPSKKQMIDLISKMPDMFLVQFFKLSAYYQGFVKNAETTKSLRSRGQYAIEAERALMMIHNMITMASNGQPVEKQIYIDMDKAIPAIASAYSYYMSSINMPVDNPDNELANNDTDDKLESISPDQIQDGVVVSIEESDESSVEPNSKSKKDNIKKSSKSNKSSKR